MGGGGVNFMKTTCTCVVLSFPDFVVSLTFFIKTVPYCKLRFLKKYDKKNKKKHL